MKFPCWKDFRHKIKQTYYMSMSTYQKRKELGLCPRCGGQTDKSGKRCINCRQYHKDYYHHKSSAGVCIRCGKKSTTKHCDGCLGQYRRYSNVRYQSRVDLGLCAHCGTTINRGESACQECRSTRVSRSQKWRLKLKLTVIAHYSGGRYACSCCGENDVRFLQIDHIAGGGNKHRNTLGKRSASHQLYKWLIDNAFPNGYDVLCSNCNQGKSVYGVCPHKLPKVTPSELLVS